LYAVDDFRVRSVACVKPRWRKRKKVFNELLRKKYGGASEVYELRGLGDANGQREPRVECGLDFLEVLACVPDKLVSGFVVDGFAGQEETDVVVKRPSRNQIAVDFAS
jgi:hypothetical protein